MIMKYYLRYYVWYYVLLIPIIGLGFLFMPGFAVFKMLAATERLVRRWARPY